MAPKRSSRAEKEAYFVSVAPQPSLLSFMRPVDVDEEVSSINGFESPQHLQAKVKAGKPLRSEALELQAMKMCDSDAYTGRKVHTVEDEIEAMAGRLQEKGTFNT